MCSLRTAAVSDKMIRTFEGRQFVTVFFNKGRTAPWSQKHLHSLSVPRLIYENTAVLRLCRPVANLWPRRPGFNSRPAHVGPMKDNVAMGQIFVQNLQFSPVSFNPSMFHTHSLRYYRSLQMQQLTASLNSTLMQRLWKQISCYFLVHWNVMLRIFLTHNMSQNLQTQSPSTKQ